MGVPIVVVAAGGLPVTLVSNGFGTPMTIAANGRGIPVTVVASGGLPVTGFVTGPDVTAPIIVSSNTISQPENAVLTHYLMANEAVTWAKVGGADAAKFTLAAGVLTLPAKDYEAPDDADANRSYIVQVQATDTASNVSAIQTITVTITDVLDTGTGAGPAIDLQAASDSGVSSTDNITSVSLPMWLVDFSGTTAAVNDDMQVEIDGVLAATVVDLTSFQLAGGPMNFGLSPIADGAHAIRLRLAYAAGGFSNYGNTINFTIDTTAPVLTSPTGTKTGSTTATLSVTTNTGSGTLYVVLSASATPPSAAQVKAGQIHTGAAAPYAANAAVAATGVRTFNATGLSSGATFYTYFMQDDVAGNSSNVAAAASFTLDAGGDPGTIFGTDLMAWYDASVQMSVSQWNDQTANARHLLMANAARQPTADANGLKTGKPGLRFAWAGNDWMETSATFTHNTTQLCIMAVVKTFLSTDYVDARIWSYAPGVFDYAEDNATTTRVPASGVTIETFRDSILHGGPMTIVAGTPCAIAVICDGANLIQYVNNVPGASPASVGTFDTANKLALANTYGGASQSPDIVFSEFVISKRAPDAGQRAALQSYFVAKWGL